MRDIVLLVVDTLRSKDFTSENAPFICSNVEHSYEVDDYYSVSPWTAPAHASMFTGELPSEHGVSTEKTFFSGKNKLANSLRSMGYSVYGLTENGMITEDFGFAEDFDWMSDERRIGGLTGETWNEIWERDSEFDSRLEKYWKFIKESILSRDLESLNSLFGYILMKIRGGEEDFNPTNSLSTIKKAASVLQRDESIFLFVNLMPVHSPYTFNTENMPESLSKEQGSRIRRVSSGGILSQEIGNEGLNSRDFRIRRKTYEAAIRYTDSLIRILYNETSEEVIFVMVGDHGELFGEYNVDGTRLINHHFGTFKELVEVPCVIFSGEKLENPGFKNDYLYDHRDLKNIILSLGGQENNFGRETVNAEYFGKSGLENQFNREVPEGYEKLFNRKSFSFITSDYKFDITSEGEYLWDNEGWTEGCELDSKPPNSLEKKADILYRWRFE